MAEGNRTGGGEGLSLQSLVVAAAASGLAAIVVSHLWKGGTVIAAAMTPVIVAITKELLQRPMESELVRKPAQQVGRLPSGSLVVPGRTAARPSEESRVLPPPDETPTLPPIRTYARSGRRPVHLKIAV